MPAAPLLPRVRGRVERTRRGRTRSASSGPRSSATYEARAKPPSALAAARAAGAARRRTTTSTGSPVATSSATTPAMPDPRRSHAPRAPRRRGGRRRAGSSGGRRARPAPGSAGSPSTSIGCRRARPGAAQHEPRLHGSRSTRCARGGRSRRRARRLAPGSRAPRRTPPRARGRRPRSTEKRTCLPSPIATGSANVRRADEQRRGRVADRRTARGARAPRRARARARRRRRPRRRARPARGPRARAPPRRAPRRRRGARRARRRAIVQPGGRAVAAVALEVLGAGVQPGEQVERRDASAPSRCRGRRRARPARRAVVALGDARGDDPDHARVPVLARRARTRCARPRSRDLGLGLEQDPRLDRAPLGVGVVELVGDLAPRARRRRSAAARAPASARRRRPAALMRGASRKPIACASRPPGSVLATRISARRPGLAVAASARSPARTSRRFSPRSGTTSATVASATRSRSSSAPAGPRRPQRSSAPASL